MNGIIFVLRFRVACTYVLRSLLVLLVGGGAKQSASEAYTKIKAEAATTPTTATTTFQIIK